MGVTGPDLIAPPFSKMKEVIQGRPLRGHAGLKK